MNEAYAAKLQKTHTLIWLFLGMLIYKFSMDLGYLYLVRVFFYDYTLNFNPLKYAVGLLWCVLLFALIRHTEHRVSSFFLYFVFLFQIVPISTVYALNDASTAYYNVLCLSFLLCELAVGYTGERPLLRRAFPVSRIMTLCYAAAAVLLVAYVVAKNGAPHLSLLNIYTVYEYRRSGVFQINKYMHYLLDWTTKVFFPLGIAKTLVDRRYPAACLIMGAMLLIYLYTGHKTFLFAIPFILVCALWARRKHFYRELFLAGCGGFSLLTLLAYFTEPGSLWYYIFSLLGNRVMLLSAQNKFLYYDYFTNHPKMGIYGIFPSWLINIPNPYEELPYSYTYDIGAIYYGSSEANVNTGFFAEGVARYGLAMTIPLLLLFALLLKQMDRFQDRSGYPLAVGIFVYPIFSLNDLHLLDSLILGPWMLLTALLLFYKPRRLPPEPPALRLKRRRLVLRPPAVRSRP